MTGIFLRLASALTFAMPIMALAQRHVVPDTLPCDTTGGPVQVHPLYSDSLCSSFLICVPRSVAPHYHRFHTEHVVVLEGTGTMLLGDSTFTIAAGHSIVVPKGTPHAVTTTSDTPLRVISVQAPYFDGTDRVPWKP